MGTVHVSVGDRIVVTHKGSSATHEIVLNNGAVEIQRAPVCVACGKEDPVYERTPGERLCGDCIERALTFRVLQRIVGDIGETDMVLYTAAETLRADDIEMRNSGMPYVESYSSGLDSMVGETYARITERIMDAIGPSLCAIILGPSSD